jgi:exodeoxyribonuclease VII large subunit
VEINKNKLILVDKSLDNAIKNKLNNDKNNYVNLINKLEILNPLLTLKRGYAITKKEGKVISSVKEVKSKDKIDIDLSDGTLKAVIE